MRAASVGMALLPSNPATAGPSPRNKSGWCQKFERIVGIGGAAASLVKVRSVVILEQRVKHKPHFQVGDTP